MLLLKPYNNPDCENVIRLYLAITYFYLGMYKEAQTSAEKSKNSNLQNRLLFHLSHKLNDEEKLMDYHQNLQGKHFKLCNLRYSRRSSKTINYR